MLAETLDRVGVRGIRRFLGEMNERLVNIEERVYPGRGQ